MTGTKSPKPDELVTFGARKQYKFIRDLGRGAFGRTVLLFDTDIEEHFVCKKFEPLEGTFSDLQERTEAYNGFVREIKLLHRLHHKNVVRAFTYHLAPPNLTGYIFMELVNGTDIKEFAVDHPETLADLFEQAVDGFCYLERSGILHRDIRFSNLLVSEDGELKIIDLGLGKRVDSEADFNKSVSVNLWCASPAEYRVGKYDFCTEVYFVGKLFEKLIADVGVKQFPYGNLVAEMCRFEPANRITSFDEASRRLKVDQTTNVGLDEVQIEVFREFSHSLRGQIANIGDDCLYVMDVEKIRTKLKQAYRTVMLSEYIPNSLSIIQTLINGTFWWERYRGKIETGVFAKFVTLFDHASADQRSVILANLHSVLDEIPRKTVSKPVIDDDDIPF